MESEPHLETGGLPWTWLDVVLLVRAYIIWALLLGQAALIVMDLAGVKLDIEHIVVSLVVGGFVGLVGHAWWVGGRPS